MASREFQAAMVSQAARTILEAERPLSMDEIFPDHGMAYGQKLSRSLQKFLLDNMFKDDLVTERRKNGHTKWEVRDRSRLMDIAAGCPPNVPEDEEKMPYHGKEVEKRARVAVAIRALKRLMAADAHPETARVQPKATLFISKKGDRYQQKQVLDKSWQGPFLDRIVEQGSLEKRDDDGMVLYKIYNRKYIQAVIDNGANPCIETLLWPDNPCKIDHVNQPPPEVQAIIAEAAESEVEVEEEKEDEPEPAQVVTQAVVDAVGTVAEAVMEPEEKEEDGEKKLDMTDAIKTLLDCYESISKNVIAQSEGQKKIVSLMVKTAQEVDHVHSKLDKLHEENVTLRKLCDKQGDGLDEMVEIVKDLAKMLDPNESSINAIRKRLGEIEKISNEHRSLLQSSNQLIKTGLGEAASAMVAQAAKVFVQQDHSQVLVKMASVEENVLDAQAKTTKMLEEVYEALEKVRGEYKNHSRAPIILQRMEAIAGELQELQGVLADLPRKPTDPGLRIASPDLSGI